jgi:hypothetical protein
VKNTKLIGAVALLASLVSGHALAGSEQKKLTLMLDWFVNPNHGPIVIAQERGYFADQGLDVEIQEPADPSTPAKLVAAGKVDLAVTYQPSLTMDVAAGLPLVRASTLIATPLNTLMVLDNGKNDSLADLKGKKIGIAIAGNEEATIGTMLAQENVAFSDVQTINVYIDVTKTNSIFLNYLDSQTKKYLSKKSNNYFDIRGVATGYLKDAVCFPFFDYDGKFKTAQIIRYNKNGKRVKEGFNTNWFHSYKPIKKDLGLKEKDKYSVKMDTFFGEHYLKGSNNIVGIVEAPKTAVILKELYPSIDWIATAGQSNLRSKNLHLLKDKKVVLFPDARGRSNNEKNDSLFHVAKSNIQKTSSIWHDVAGEYGFNTCDILDKHDAKEGSDIADYIFDTDFEGY